DYAQFLALFAEPNANEALRHMTQITPDRFAPLGVLPAALRTPKILAAVPHGQAATDLAIALELAIRIRGADAGPAIAARWARAKDAKALFDKAAADLEPEAFGGSIPPAPDLPPPFGAVRTRKALEAVALEFRNCLRDYTTELAQGRMAVYVWRAREKAAVALTLDAAGWRLAEALGENNVDLEEPTLREIVAVLEDVNVRTGPPVISLVGRLQAYGAGREAYSNREPGFVGELEMGDLWN
ncbi:MAG: hypothetical protein AAGB25_04580, partial [Pseudomonadota bacterium]